jgi:hypothetical protein
MEEPLYRPHLSISLFHQKTQYDIHFNLKKNTKGIKIDWIKECLKANILLDHKPFLVVASKDDGGEENLGRDKDKATTHRKGVRLARTLMPVSPDGKRR